MSRSYKKHPGYSYRSKFGKKMASHKARRNKYWLPNGSSYKKIYDTWNICDSHSVYFSYQEVKERVERYNSLVLNGGYYRFGYLNQKTNPERFLDYVYRYYMK